MTEKKILIPRSVGGTLHAVHFLSLKKEFNEIDKKPLNFKFI